MKAFIVTVALVYPAFLALLFFFLNRGKIRLSEMLVNIAYSLLIGLPLIAGSFYRWNAANLVLIPILWILPLVFMAPFLVSKWLNVLKGRESAFQAVSFSISLLFFYSILFVPQGIAPAAVFCGMVFMSLFFYSVYRYPCLNTSLMRELIDVSASEVSRTGKYSSKPVIIRTVVGKRFVTGIYGLSLLVKDSSVICRISKRRHQKIGSPNLEEFFTLLCEKIRLESAK